jgi:acetyltransferase-like isoleucine patch superfamily enzyme
VGPLRDLRRRLGYELGPRAASYLRKRWILVRHPHAHIRFGRGVYLGPGFSLHIPAGGTLTVGDDVEFRRDFRAEIWGDGRVTIGAGSVFTYGVVLQCSTSIEIGERCVVAQGTTLVDGNHRFRDLDRPMIEQGYDFHRMRIGDDAFITAKCTVLAEVGERAIVGANSVVTRPVPPFTVTVGAPAKPIDYFGPPEGAP